jgi:hypothetical protein
MANSKIRTLPGAEQVSGPASLRPTGANPERDVTAPMRGQIALAEGVSQLAAGAGAAAQYEIGREKAADLAQAEASWLRGSLDIGNRFQQDGDYASFNKRVGTQSSALLDQIAKTIRDPDARQAWKDETELKRIALVDAVNDHGRELSRSNDVGKLETSLTDLSTVYADPTTPQVIRDQAKANMAAQIEVAVAHGLIAPADGERMRRASIDGSAEQLAVNRASYEILVRPDHVATKLGIPNETDDGAGLVAAISQANGGKLPGMEFSLARMTAEALGDANFPNDPKLAAAYLADPEKGGEYVDAAVKMLQDRYKGDMAAIVIAADPEGGTTLADQWVKAGHDESVLPAGVRARYRATMSGYKTAVSGERLPIIADPGVDLEHTDPMVLDRFETLQSNFGESLRMISAARSKEHNDAVGGADKSQHLDGTAIDLDVSKLSEERRIQLIQMASSMGFTGIGVYKNSIHLDTGPLRAWGSSYHNDASVPAWARSAIDAHVAGTVMDVPLVYLPPSPEYAAIPFDKRLVLAGEARRAARENNATLQASLETIAANAPVAVANTGVYDGNAPTVNDFVKAYGGSDGIAKFKAYQSTMDTAKILYGFRTMPTDQIMAQVQAATPVSSGNDAVLESRRFEQVSAAAEQTLKAREADPAGYVMNVMPKVAEAFKGAGDDPQKFAQALTSMQAAQSQLGMTDMQLLPKQMATDAVTAFNNLELPADQRVKGVAGLLLATGDESQKLAIYNQLVKAGLPEYTQGAVAAMMRNDVKAAQNLMRAVMIDPEKLAGVMPNGITGTQINATIQDRIFDEGQIGDVIYGIHAGSTDNFQRVLADSTLIERDVKMHLLDGSAGGDLNRAVDLAVKDMFGDVQVVAAAGVRVTLPAADDPRPMRDGFAGLRPRVADALKTDMHNGMVQLLGEDTDIAATGMQGIVSMGIDNAVGRVLDEGYFINAGGDQFQFFNTFTGTVIGNADGTPLLFKRSDVLAAGAASPRPSEMTPSAPIMDPSAYRLEPRP